MTRKARSKLAEEIGKAIAALRSTKLWTQGRLARESGVKPGLISDYERGKTVPDVASLDRMLAAMDCTFSDLDRARRFALTCPAETRPNGNTECSALEDRYRDLLALMKELADVTARAHAFLDSHAGFAERSDSWSALLCSAPVPEDRVKAEELWERLKRYRSEAQLALVTESSEFAHWALCERVCRESERMTSRDPDKAIAFSGLALAVASQIRAEENWQNRLRAYAHAHVGNALRAKGELRQAAEAFDRFDALWGPDGPDLLEEARALDMKASLRRAERRFPEALDLYETALRATAGDALRPWILINMSKTMEESGDLALAIELLAALALFLQAAEQERVTGELVKKLVRYLEAARHDPKLRFELTG